MNELDKIRKLRAARLAREDALKSAARSRTRAIQATRADRLETFCRNVLIPAIKSAPLPVVEQHLETATRLAGRKN